MNCTITGYGLGLRTEHYADFIGDSARLFRRVDWLEIITENYMVLGGKPLVMLEKIRLDFPMVMHGVSLSIGGTAPLDSEYLHQLKRLIQRVEPAWVSDHLCWTGTNGLNLHDLLPLPYTQAALQHLVDRISQVQEFLGRKILIENVSSYVTYRVDEMSEWEFISELLQRSGCDLLLDVNNVYVSSVNHGFDPHKFIDAMPAAKVKQIHLAGHENHGDYIIDTHDHPICDAVWDLYGYTIRQLGAMPTMIERDDNIPPLTELLDELDTVRNVAKSNLPNLSFEAQVV